jgi:hypothetical protein
MKLKEERKKSTKLVSRQLQILTLLKEECPEDFSDYHQQRIDWLNKKNMMLILGIWNEGEERKDPSKHQNADGERKTKRKRP